MASAAWSDWLDAQDTMVGRYPAEAAGRSGGKSTTIQDAGSEAEGAGAESRPRSQEQTAPDQAAQDGGESGGEGDESEPQEVEEEDRPGIPVRDELVLGRCASCHAVNDEGEMSRISYLRKSPEGWELSLKRMIRLNNVQVSPDEARQIVRYLANDHGLARAEAESAMYEVERRVHWSEEAYDEKLRQSCAECHTLGRVLAQRRDAKEWKLLKATHLAFFPLAQWQAFRGGRRQDIDWESMSEADAAERWEQLQNQQGPDQADSVLAELAKTQGLFTPEWEAWQVNRREVPVSGEWTVVGHEIGRGDVRGEVTITRVDEDAYSTRWRLVYEDGRTVQREGKGLLYAGYSWRGRSTTTAPKEPPTLREVLLLSEDWSRFEGRVFTGEYHELGMDVTLHRRGTDTRLFAVDRPDVRAPSVANELLVLGANLPEDLSPDDFHLGEGVTVTAAERRSTTAVELRIDVDRDATLGRRFLSFRAQRGPEALVIYDTIDYIDIRPDQGFARIGGTFRPRQLERFEVVAVNRGPDGEPYTDDDFDVRVVPASWSLEEFPIREGDDDVQFVGEIDPETGVFTPGADGPNPARRWQANNIGDVYVVATATLEVAKRPEPPEPSEEGAAATAAEADPAPLVLEQREFRARGHLLVTVPIYVNWDKYEWDRR